jgi:hypothetical protein
MFSGTINQVFNAKAVADATGQIRGVNKHCKIPGVAVSAVVLFKD